MKKFIYSIFVLTFFAVSCKDNSQGNASEGALTHQAVTEHDHDEHDHDGHDHDEEEHDHGTGDQAELNEDGFYGETFDIDGAITLAEALNDISDKDSLQVKLTGNVSEVCQVKGCWMTMKEGDESVMVKFKDYGFFVPKDCSGKTAFMTGVMKREVQSVEEQRHYLEDAEASQEEIDAITEPKQKLTFLASGVKLQ